MTVDHDARRTGVNHVGFVVDDLDAVLERARFLGVEPHLDVTYEPGRHAYILDPDGHELELVQY